MLFVSFVIRDVYCSAASGFGFCYMFFFFFCLLCLDLISWALWPSAHSVHQFIVICRKMATNFTIFSETLNAAGGQTLRNVFRSDDVTNTSEPTVYTENHVEGKHYTIIDFWWGCYKHLSISEIWYSLSSTIVLSYEFLSFSNFSDLLKLLLTGPYFKNKYSMCFCSC